MAEGAALPPGSFDRIGAGDDLAFCAPPRLVTDIDEAAVAALTGVYRSLLPEGDQVLDLTCPTTAGLTLLAKNPADPKAMRQAEG